MNTTCFENRLRNLVAVKDIPNTEFTPDTFRFGDYFDKEHIRESHAGDLDADNVDALVDQAFTPYRVYFAGVTEISVTISDEDMVVCDVEVQLPDDEDRQRLLAELVADAWARRCER
ncbi:hypothetical protein [Salinibaculum rarum]|uniref:hypothetical protein n=1 Tax=Salinibaculum rarum TaxID=3058903 RepID=UPI00265DB23E|nr:hypothetical protein [Salinibaculum sp. KK48]